MPLFGGDAERFRSCKHGINCSLVRRRALSAPQLLASPRSQTHGQARPISRKVTRCLYSASVHLSFMDGVRCIVHSRSRDDERNANRIVSYSPSFRGRVVGVPADSTFWQISIRIVTGTTGGLAILRVA